MKTNTLIDNYILKSQEFAKPILYYLRDVIHETCPDVEEKIKWGMPFFDYKGSMMCMFAAFKQHCTFGFYKAALMKDPILLQNANKENAMGHLGRITSLKDLPPKKKLVAYIKEAMQLNEQNIKVKKAIKPIDIQLTLPPDYFLKELKKNKKAYTTFELFSASCKKEYIQWITEAKTEATRNKRIAQAIEWMQEGKERHWKYK